ncbi:Imm1 family immunity protein [Amycolatopsis rhabdoformis]|uniref:Imm1 family immunity protein n=1 Tax=Amycolatopsis rhabdoformis TaxID=1448059 RepID=A0ABZ1IKB0_9PSEU|nr:Imm1 family immunity protein [Amycolatopsis rhabdoformis]WSE34964.1 Imm1 family immunity protein [Amycolatopsis rhabdoformis]
MTTETTLGASVPTWRDGQEGGEYVTLVSQDDVTRLAELLAQPWADSGSIDAAGGSLVVHLTEEWGYLDYYGDAGSLETDGDPASPEVFGEGGHRAGTGLPVADVIAALREFVATGGQLPRSVPWRDI